MSRYSYVKYDELSTGQQAAFKRQFEELTAMVDVVLPPGRAQSLVHTKLEEAYMWVGKAIRDGQISRTGTVDELPERNNG